MAENATEMRAEKTRAAAWFRELRDQIVAAFEGLEDSHTDGPFADMEAGRFDVSETKRAAAASLKRSASIFRLSMAHFPKSFAKRFPGRTATGITGQQAFYSWHTRLTRMCRQHI